MNARPKPQSETVWWRPRKAHDSDIRTVTEKAKTVVGIRTEQTAGGATGRAGGEIPQHFYSKNAMDLDQIIGGSVWHEEK